jgi:hypothetical protein
MARHPGLVLSNPKEPKFFLCAGTSPRRNGHAGPGDGHSAREWIWRRDRYEALFDNAPVGALKGESTPFYLYDLAAQARIARLVPEAKLIAVLRDPICSRCSLERRCTCSAIASSSTNRPTR